MRGKRSVYPAEKNGGSSGVLPTCRTICWIICGCRHVLLPFLLLFKVEREGLRKEECGGRKSANEGSNFAYHCGYLILCVRLRFDLRHSRCVHEYYCIVTTDGRAHKIFQRCFVSIFLAGSMDVMFNGSPNKSRLHITDHTRNSYVFWSLYLRIADRSFVFSEQSERG
jgi:hypothetical protein